MANTYVDYTAVASQTDYNFSFEYLRDEHVKVKVNDVIVTNYTIVTSPVQLIRFNTAPTAGAEIKIYRDSRGDFDPIVDFQDGSVLTQEPLDTAYLHNLYVAQETSEGVGGELLFKKNGVDYDAEGNKIINLGTPTANTDAANKGYVDQTIDNSIALGGSPAIVSLGGYNVTDITGSLTQSLANWTAPTATGSSEPRTLTDRFSDVVNVLDYGVKNDGTEPSGDSNATRIQSAINDANGKTVYFPNGTYTINAPIVVNSGDILRGSNATISKTGTTTYSGIDAIFFLEDSGSSVNNVRISSFNLSTTESVPYNAYGIYCVQVQHDNEFDDLKIESVKYGLYFGGGYQLVIRNVLVNACYKGVVIDADLTAGTSNMTSVFATQLSVSNAGHGYEFNKVIYSSIEGYAFGINTTNSDNYVANETPIAIKTTSCNAMKLHIGGEAIVGTMHFSSASYGQMNCYFVANTASQQYLPDSLRIANGLSVTEQAYFSYASSSWSFVTPQIEIGNAAWTTPSDKTKFLYLGANAYIKFQNGYCNLLTSKLDVTTGTNATVGWSNEKTRFLANYQTENSNNTFQIGNDFFVHSEVKTYSTATTTDDIHFDIVIPQSRVLFASAVVEKPTTPAINSRLTSIEAVSGTYPNGAARFSFDADVNGLSVRYFIFGIHETA